MTRWEILTDWIKKNGFRNMIEVGVAKGSTASNILKNCDLDFYGMVEHKPSPELYELIQKTDDRKPNGIANKPIAFFRMDSVSAAGLFADDSLDLVFIDANHSFQAVATDIRAWLPKIRKGGIICGHDYNHEGNWNDLAEAVDMIFPERKLVLDTAGGGGNQIWWLYVR